MIVSASEVQLLLGDADGPGEVGAFELGQVGVGAGQIRPREVGSVKIGAPEIGVAQVCPRELRPTEYGPRQLGLPRGRPP